MNWILLFALGWPADAPVSPPLPPDHARRLTESAQLFESKVATILKEQCFQCHGGEKTRSGFDLSTRDTLLAGGDQGIAVVPFSIKESRLLRLVQHTEEPYMPGKEKKLPAEMIELLTRWIDLGAAYSSPLSNKAPKPKNLVVTPKDREFWSFGAPRETPVPAIRDEWIQNPIDAFILQRLQAAKIRPNPRASLEVLVRRITLDLTGIPPTPETLQQIRRDSSPHYLQNYVRGLLKSVAHGERWGRHWLDIARFAESHGYEQDYDRHHAWPYRDWVTKAIQSDLPYNKFVAWQIAGDELSPGNTDAFLATGFLGAGVHATQITKSQVEKERYDELDDIVRTIGGGMLGLSINCCRCHDSKYDPIPMTDYYRLISTFTKTVRSDQDLPLPDPDLPQRIAAWEKSRKEASDALARFDGEHGLGVLEKWKSAQTNVVTAKTGWTNLFPSKATSQNGATLLIKADGKIQSTGANPGEDAYAIEAITPIEKVRQFRVEVFADKSLVNGGPGRAGNGNFALSNIQVTAKPAKPLPNVRYRPVVLKLAKPRATFQQNGLPLSAAIDADAKTGWAVDPEFGKDHVGAFEVENAPEYAGGTILEILLEFRTNTSHTIGNFRLGVSDQVSQLDLKDAGLPAGAKEFLQGKPIDASTKAALLAWLLAKDPEREKIVAKIADLDKAKPAAKTVKALVCSEGLPAIRLHTQGGDYLEQTHFLKRGDPNQKGEVASQGFLQVLSKDGKDSSSWIKPMPEGARTPGLRANLARWITDEKDGAGGLLARVIVNRLWHHHFGRGLTPTINDFGIQGDRPTHPELLEWLAGELVRSGWSLQHIHTLIVTSATYQQTSTTDSERLKADPTNRLYWRFTPRRLEAEIVRDSMLAVSGRLDPTPFGPGTMDPNHRRRSVYFFLKRSALPADLMVFDAPDTLQIAEARPTTTVAPQALYLLNGRLARECATDLAKVLGGSTPDPKSYVDAAYLRLLGREPLASERAASTEFLAKQEKALASEEGIRDPGMVARVDLVHALLQLNEFLYLP
jgi:hypothetical protein